MQNALIRKKLEEQRENFRKRQEQEQKEQIQKQGGDRKEPAQDGSLISPAQSPEEIPKSGPLDSPIKKAPAQHQVLRQHAPSPNIFTPTSVLRKMTAEKEGDSGKMNSDKKKAITGAQSRQQPQMQQQQQFMGGNLNQLDRMMQIQAQNDAFGKVNWDAQSPIKPPGKTPSNPPNFFTISFYSWPSNRQRSWCRTLSVQSNDALSSKPTKYDARQLRLSATAAAATNTKDEHAETILTAAANDADEKTAANGEPSIDSVHGSATAKSSTAAAHDSLSTISTADELRPANARSSKRTG